MEDISIVNGELMTAGEGGGPLYMYVYRLYLYLYLYVYKYIYITKLLLANNMAEVGGPYRL